MSKRSRPGHIQTSILFSWRHALTKSDLPAMTRLVAWTASHHMNNEGGSCYPSVATLAREAGCSERTVQRALDLLRECGWLRRDGTATVKTTRGDQTVFKHRAILPPTERGATESPPQQRMGRQGDTPLDTKGGDSLTPPKGRQRVTGCQTVKKGVSESPKGGDSVTPEVVREVAIEDATLQLALANASSNGDGRREHSDREALSHELPNFDLKPYLKDWQSIMGKYPSARLCGHLGRVLKPVERELGPQRAQLCFRNFVAGSAKSPKFMGSVHKKVEDFAETPALYEDPDWYMSDRDRADFARFAEGVLA